jgi:hypothetical protein
MADERRAAKKAYLAALQQQVVSEENNPRNFSNNVTNAKVNTKMTDRERVLEEKRLNFLRKQDKSLQPRNEPREAPSSSSLPMKENYTSNNNRNDNYEQTKPNLSNWQREGYPSEYAYAQDKGSLNIQSKDIFQNTEFNAPSNLHIQIPEQSQNQRNELRGMNMYINSYICTCIYICTMKFIYVYLCVYILVYIYVYMYVYVFIYNG